MKFLVLSTPMKEGARATGSSGLALRTVRLAAGAALLLGAFGAAPVFAQVALPPINAAPTSEWAETFLTGMTATTAMSLDSYSSGIYSADSAWLPPYGGCNGWVLSSSSAMPMPAQDPGCSALGGEIVGSPATPTAWSFLEAMTTALAKWDGDNYAVASMTNRIDGTQIAGVQLERTAPLPVALMDGHYYVLSVQFAEVHCQSDDPTKTTWRDASEVLTLNGSQSPAQSPCTLPISETELTPDGPIHLGSLYSGVILAESGMDTITDFKVQNETAVSTGNDVAFNLPEIVDVTPQLYKSFNPDPSAADGNHTVVPGGTATLTFTVMNTDDYLEKDDWSFEDVLPAGLTVNSFGPENCGTGTVDETGTTLGGTVIAVTGTLDAGQVNAKCIIQVIVNVPDVNDASYENGPDTVQVDGLLPPNSVTLTTDQLTATKTVVSVSTDAAGTNKITDVSKNPAVTASGEYINYQIEIQNSTDQDVDISSIEDDTTTGFNGSGGPITFDLSKCTGTTVPAASGGTPGSVTCTAQYQVTSADMTATPAYINNAAVVMIAGEPDHIPTNKVGTPVLPPSLSITKSANSTIIAVNKVITFSYTVTNTGSVPLSGVTVYDSKDTGFTGSGTAPVMQLPACLTDLAPGTSTTCTAQYTVTPADMAAGSITNTAIATGWAPGFTPITTLNVKPDGTGLDPGEAWNKNSRPLTLTNGMTSATPVPTLDARVLALLALLLGGLGYFVQRKMRR